MPYHEFFRKLDSGQLPPAKFVVNEPWVEDEAMLAMLRTYERQGYEVLVLEALDGPTVPLDRYLAAHPLHQGQP